MVARELYALDGGERFETENLAERPAEASRIRELAALLPPVPGRLRAYPNDLLPPGTP